jgi:hypothetical protein
MPGHYTHGSDSELQALYIVLLFRYDGAWKRLKRGNSPTTMSLSFGVSASQQARTERELGRAGAMPAFQDKYQLVQRSIDHGHAITPCLCTRQ